MVVVREIPGISGDEDRNMSSETQNKELGTNDDPHPDSTNRNGENHHNKPREKVKKHRQLFRFFSRHIDTTDSQKDVEFSIISIIFLVISLVAFVADIVSDVIVASLLYNKGYDWWFGLTLAFIIVPGLVVNIFSLRWYFDDENNTPPVIDFKKPPKTRNDLFLIILAHVFGMGPAVRYVYLLLYGIKSRGQREKRIKKQIQEPIGSEDAKNSAEDDYSYGEMLVYGNRDACMLSLIESFLEGAPQLILQIYILIIRGSPVSGHVSLAVDIWQVISITISLINLSWSLASYHRALRLAVINKRNITRCGQILQFFWRLGTISSRVFAMALFASHFKYWLTPIFIGHWGIMTAWIIHQNTHFCSDESGKKHYLREYLFDMVMGAVYIFCYINLKEERTRYKYIAYYILVFLENCVGVSLWYRYSDYTMWYHKPAMAWVFLSFIGGIAFMLIYYAFLHPNGRMVVVTIKETDNVKLPETQTLFGVCCSSSLTSQSLEDNSTPLEPTNKPAIYTIDEDNETNKIPETGL